MGGNIGPGAVRERMTPEAAKAFTAMIDAIDPVHPSAEEEELLAMALPVAVALVLRVGLIHGISRGNVGAAMQVLTAPIAQFAAEIDGHPAAAAIATVPTQLMAAGAATPFHAHRQEAPETPKS